MRNIYMYKLACNDVVPTDIRGNVYIRCQSGKLYVVGVAYIYGRNICTWISGQLPAGIYGTWTGKGKSCYGMLKKADSADSAYIYVTIAAFR